MTARNDEPTPALKEYAKHSLYERTKTLHELLTKNGVPSILVARQIVLIFKAGLAYCGKALFQAHWEWMVDSAVGAMGFCQTCEHLPEPDELRRVPCSVCDEIAEKEFSKMLLEQTPGENN